jgi:hypothetical protein
MRKPRLFLGILPLTFLLGAYGLGALGLGGCSSGGSSSNDCFDYSTFTASPTSVSFNGEVLPIFRTSCALSTSCHGCDPTMPGGAGCTNGGISPFLGIGTSDGALTPAQVAAIFAQTVGQPAALQSSIIPGGPAMVGNPDMKIIAAGDPQHSFMMYKLDGDPNASNLNAEVSCATLTCASTTSCGQSMPSGGPQLDAASLNTIRTWIAQGAMNN